MQDSEAEFFGALKARGEGPGLVVRRIGGEMGKGLFADRCGGSAPCSPCNSPSSRSNSKGLRTRLQGLRRRGGCSA